MAERSCRGCGAPPRVGAIERFADHDYGGPQDVMKAFGDVSNHP